uniref:Uncharacterized protein n=1 Tax=Glossina pallidipes TaxID=7398 RepID=A0A1A9ZAX9_GLOPL
MFLTKQRSQRSKITGKAQVSYNDSDFGVKRVKCLSEHVEKHLYGVYLNQYYRTNGAVATTRYALSSMRDGARKETVCPINNATDADSRPKSTSNASEMDEDEYVGSESEGSNDSWTTEEFSSSFIGRYAPHNRLPPLDQFKRLTNCQRRYEYVTDGRVTNTNKGRAAGVIQLNEPKL